MNEEADNKKSGPSVILASACFVVAVAYVLLTHSRIEELETRAKQAQVQQNESDQEALRAQRRLLEEQMMSAQMGMLVQLLIDACGKDASEPGQIITQ